MAEDASLLWLGATYGLLGPGWQASFRVEQGDDAQTVVVLLSQEEHDAFPYLGQSKLEKRQAELILQHGGRERIEASLREGETPEQVEVSATPSNLASDLARWRVGR